MKKVILGTVAVLLILGSLGAIISGIKERSLSPTERENRDRESTRIAVAATIAREIKRSMRDPDSFTLSSVRLVEKSDTICYVYRARNGFGGINVGHAILSSAGRFYTEESSGFAPLWNRECAHKPSLEAADSVTFLLNHPTS